MFFICRNRRLVIVVVLIILLLLYFFPNLVGIGSRSTSTAEPSFWCLFNQLTAFTSGVANYDAFIRHHPNRLDEERPYVHFIGNGHLGLGIAKKDDTQLRIFHERSLATSVGLQPLVSVGVDFDYFSESGKIFLVRYSFLYCNNSFLCRSLRNRRGKGQGYLFPRLSKGNCSFFVFSSVFILSSSGIRMHSNRARFLRSSFPTGVIGSGNHCSKSYGNLNFALIIRYLYKFIRFFFRIPR